MITGSKEPIIGVLIYGMESLLLNSMHKAIVCIHKSTQIGK